MSSRDAKVLRSIVAGLTMFVFFCSCGKPEAPSQPLGKVTSVFFDYHAVTFEVFQHSAFRIKPENIIVELVLPANAGPERKYLVPSKFDERPGNSFLHMIIQDDTIALESPASSFKQRSGDSTVLVFEVASNHYRTVLSLFDRRMAGDEVVPIVFDANFEEVTQSGSLTFHIEKEQTSKLKYVALFQDTTVVYR